MDHSSKTSGFIPVIFALSGNMFISAIKFAGFFFSGSGALFSEAVHSFADTLNQGLLLIGLKMSKRQPDENYSYGYGQERFLWALISACGIFFLGSGVTVYHGINSLLHHEGVHISSLIFAILGLSFIIETFTLVSAWRELKRNNPRSKFMHILRDGDPTTIAVLYEDSVAVIGVLIALVSIALSFITGNYYWDAIGSICIGILLGIVAVILINKNRKYLIGKNIPRKMKKRIIKIMESDPTIEKVYDFKSSILDVGQYQIKCEVEFNGPALMKGIMANGTLREEYAEISKDYQEFVKFLVEYVDRVPRLMGNHIDRIEKKIQEEYPQIKHIDIEIN